MAAVRLVLALAAALTLQHAPQSAAAPFAVQLGDTRIGLDAPPGFSDTTFTGSPRLQELAESLTSASNRILLFALTDADLRRFTVGDQPEAKRYMVAVTPRAMERERLSPATFASFVTESLRDLGTPPPSATAGDYRAHLDAAPGRLTLLSELRREREVVSVLQGVRVPQPARSSAPPQYALSSTTLLLLRGKPVNLTVHAMYEGPADLEWIRSITARWVEDIQRLNAR